MCQKPKVHLYLQKVSDIYDPKVAKVAFTKNVSFDLECNFSQFLIVWKGVNVKLGTASLPPNSH
jgi:hypothetical protein